MIYLRARFYEPEMNRFAQKDTLHGSIADGISLNRYLYCQSDPVNFADYNGLQMVNVCVADGGGKKTTTSSSGSTTPRVYTNTSQPKVYSNSYQEYQDQRRNAVTPNPQEYQILRRSGVNESYSQYVNNKIHTQFPSYQEYMQGKAMGNPYYVTYNNGKPTPVAYQRAFYTNNQSNNTTSGISQGAPEVYDVTDGQYSCGRDNVNQYFSSDSNVYGLLIGGLSITFKGLFQGLSLSVKNAVRPANIGAGIFAKNIKQELSEIARLDSRFGTALNILAYGAVAIDVGQGIYNNIQSGASATEIISDAVIDAAITGGGIFAAAKAGAAFGALVGSFLPGAGNVVGAVAGVLVSVGIYYFTDIKENASGNTLREEIKIWAKNLW